MKTKNRRNFKEILVLLGYKGAQFGSRSLDRNPKTIQLASKFMKTKNQRNFKEILVLLGYKGARLGSRSLDRNPNTIQLASGFIGNLNPNMSDLKLNVI